MRASNFVKKNNGCSVQLVHVEMNKDVREMLGLGHREMIAVTRLAT